MENKIEVGKSYVWELEGYTPDDIFIVNKIENNIAYYTYGDGVESSDNINGGWFDDAILLENSIETTDNVVNPAHYNSTKITALEVVNDWSLDFYLGNVVKYIARHEKKGNALQDLKKAQEYLSLKIKLVEGVDLENKDK